MNTLPRPRPLVIIILDGWGVRSDTSGNAIAQAATPTMDMLARHYPLASLAASGLEVGLPDGVAGNSETGHRNIGAGKVEYQMMAQIDQAIEDGSFFTNQTLLGAIDHAVSHGSSLHLMGLVSNGGVHSHINHLKALLKLLDKKNLRDRVYIHVFTDGRDTPPNSAPIFIRALEEALRKYDVGAIASATGRFYAMDRNKNWERTQATYDMLTGGERPPGASSIQQALSSAYQGGLSDERLPATVITRGGAPVATIVDNDAVIFFNFRPDRARQLAEAFVHPSKTGFAARPITNLYFATLSNYGSELKAQAAFDDERAEYPLARVLAEAGLSQLHIAETEKYAHITYYLNVGHEKPYLGEEHSLIHSSSARNFAEHPRMEAAAITERLLDDITHGKFDVYFANFANADMVGHTGDLAATMTACAYLDELLGSLVETTLGTGGALLISSDHGNAEQMVSVDGRKAFTEHTKNPVPLHYVREELRRTVGRSDTEVDTLLASPIGVLADVAPSILDILRLDKPSSMTGVSLLGSLQ